MVETLDRYEADLDFQIVGETTARQLLGDFERPDEFGLLDSPLYIRRSEQKEVIHYDVVVDRDPFSAEEFIRFFNQASPSEGQQSPAMIGGDWVLAVNSSESALTRLHAKIPAWAEMKERAEGYTAIARNASRPYTHHEQRYDEWVKFLPVVRSMDEIRQDFIREAREDVARSIEAIQSGDVRAQLKKYEIEKLQKAPTVLLLKRLEQRGFANAKMVLSGLIKAQYETRRKHHQNDVIKWFARKPFSERHPTQSMLVNALTERDPDVTDRFLDAVEDQVANARLAAVGYAPCIDDDGVPGYVPFTSGVNAWQNPVPIDRRDLDNWKLVSINEDYEAEQLRIKVWSRYSTQSQIRISTNFYNRNIRKVREVTAVPLIRWNTDGEKRIVDITTVYEKVDGTDKPTMRLTDGVFGLVTVQYLSGDVELPKRLGIPGAGRDQVMGAAQMPLLALMFRNKIMRGRFVELVEKAA